MRLVRLDIRRYRSIREQSGDDSIEFEGLDCLVGKNNAGKTNILSAVKFLLNAPEKELDEELYWQKETEQTVAVHGFFAVDDADLERIENDEKREAVSESLLDKELLEGNGHQNLASESERILGICKQVSNGHSSPDSMLLDFRPEDDRLSNEYLEGYRDTRWEDQKDGNKSYSESDYARDMEEEFPEVAELIDSKHEQKNIWKDKLEDYIQSRPSEVDFELQPTEFRQGAKTIILDQFLPQIISIPAIREVESTTKRGGEFGDLVKQISSEIQEELDQQLRDELDAFQPRDHASIERVEGQINQYLGGTFDEQSVQIDFPSFSTEYLFKNADLRIQEDYVEDLSKDNVGEGVKGTVQIRSEERGGPNSRCLCLISDASPALAEASS